MADQSTIERAQRGDVAAFGEIYREYEGRIYGLALRMVLDPGRAEDLTQDVFVRAWRKLASYGGRSAFYTWLHRLAVNVVLNELRRKHREPEPLDPADHRLEGGRRAAASGAGLSIDLERAITTLPPQARLVFWLHDVEGYRHAEVGEILGIAEGTSKAHLHRARMRLRETLAS